MKQRTLRDDLCDHYQEQRLPPEALSRLTEMVEAVESPASRRKRSTAVLAVAASALLALAAVWLWIGSNQPSAASVRLASAIAEEIAMNHNKTLDVEFPSDSLVELRSAMDKLDFSLLEARSLGSRDLRLIGARYCSIQGKLAAQLRLETLDGDAVTLYQTPLVAGLASLPPQELRVRGLRIELWEEEGIFFGMARALD